VAWALNPLASLHAMRREFDLAQRYLDEANETLAELGSVNASVNHHEALVMLLAGEWARAEAVLRPATDRLRALGDGGLLATTSAMLAQALYAQDRLDEAEACCEVAHREGAKDDIVTQVIWRGVQAKTTSRRGEGLRGEALAREAVALAEHTDLLLHRGDAMLDLGRVLRIGSREQEAEIAISSGFALHRRKGNVARLEGEG
jgi:ATP/maltotriose-dependent transcriptional regulator MalT